MITTLETEKARMEHAHLESIQVLKEHVTTQVMETLTEKNADEGKGDELAKKFKDWRNQCRRHTRPEWLKDEPQVSVGGLLEQEILGVKHSKRGRMDQRKQCTPEKKEDQRDKGKRKQCTRKEGRSTQGTVGSKTNHMEGS
jgi:hypothetical protein